MDKAYLLSLAADLWKAFFESTQMVGISLAVSIRSWYLVDLQESPERADL